MATKRKTKRPTVRRKKTTLSSGPKRRRRISKKNFLNELTSPAKAKSSVIALGGNAVGVGIALGLSKFVIPQTWGKPGKIGAAVVGGFILNSFGGHLSNVGNGLFSSMLTQVFSPIIGLSEDANFASDNILDEQPLYLDESGTPLVLEMDSNGEEYFREMSADEMEGM